MPSLAAYDHQRGAHIVEGIADLAVTDLMQGFVAEFRRRYDIRQHLGRMKLVGQPVVDRYTGIRGEASIVKTGSADRSCMVQVD